MLPGRRPDADRVIPGLWIGAAPSARQAQRLVGEGITAVVDLRAEGGPPARWPEPIRIVSAPLVDHGTPSKEQLSYAAGQAYRLLREGHEVLIHCRAGMERSVTVACAVLLLQGWSLPEAYRQVTQARRGAAPTEGQLNSLRALDHDRAASAENN